MKYQVIWNLNDQRTAETDGGLDLCGTHKEAIAHARAIKRDDPRLIVTVRRGAATIFEA